MNAPSQLHQNEELIQKLTQIVLDNLDNEQFGVSELARQVGMNRSHLYRKVILLTKKSLSQFIREIRLSAALKILKEESVTVSEAAYKVGFNNPSYFNSCFHKYFGFPPGEARRQDTGKSMRNKKRNDGPVKYLFSFDKKYVFLAVFFFLLSGSVAALLFLKRYNPLSEEKSIALLPFQNLSEEKGNEYFVDGLVEDLQNRISVIKELKVTSRTSSEMYRERGKKSVPEIASELGVTYIVEGSVQRYGDKVRIIVTLIDAINDNPIWAKKYEQDIENVFNTQSEIARKIAFELNMTLTPKQKTHLQENRTKNVKAFELYHMGLFFQLKRTKDGCKTSIQYFEKAIDEDPSYSEAYAGLAHTYYLIAIKDFMDRQEARNKAVELALMALELDENLAEAHRLLGGIYDYVDWEWEKAKNAFQCALEFNPNNAKTHADYSEHLSILGRHEEARKHIDLALELDPFSFIVRHVSAATFHSRGHFQDALAEFQKCNELQENHHYTLLGVYEIYWELGDEEKSYEALRKLLKQTSSYDLEIADKRYKDSGLQSVIEWKLMIDELHEEHPYFIACTYGLIGEDQKALEWLERAFALNRINPQLSFNPHFKNLHNNPGFLAILEKMGLEAKTRIY